MWYADAHGRFALVPRRYAQYDPDMKSDKRFRGCEFGNGTWLDFLEDIYRRDERADDPEGGRGAPGPPSGGRSAAPTGDLRVTSAQSLTQ